MKRVSGDRIFFILVVALAIGGFAIFSSASLGLLARESGSVSRDILLQAGLGLGLGALALLAARAIPLASLKKLSPWAYGAALALTALVFLPGIGTHAGGATRWINLASPPSSRQSS